MTINKRPLPFTQRITAMEQHAQTVKIRQFIVEHVSSHPNDIAQLVCQRFRISRQAVSRHLREMVSSGTLEASGRTRSRSYALKPLAYVDVWLDAPGLEEHVPWEKEIRPHLASLPKNVLSICNYGFTEMLNNAIDHSESPRVHVQCIRTPEYVDIKIDDNGVGIFRKIRAAFGLTDELAAITELAKGKLTTDPERHSGEGIFFTSRVFDHFAILSGSLYFSHTRPSDDWLIENRTSKINGTLVSMTISSKSRRKLSDVFNLYSSEDDDYQFSKTNVPVKLLQYGSDSLLSRSQAKRLLSRFEVFREVLLDFSGVSAIGQAFADEVFRVYANAHPEVNLTAINVSPEVQQMINRARTHRSVGPGPPAEG